MKLRTKRRISKSGRRNAPMRPPQIAALGLGAAVVAAGAGLVWHEYRANAPAPRGLSFAAIEPAKPEPHSTVPLSPAAPETPKASSALQPAQQTAKAEPAMPPEAPV